MNCRRRCLARLASTGRGQLDARAARRLPAPRPPRWPAPRAVRLEIARPTRPTGTSSSSTAAGRRRRAVLHAHLPRPGGRAAQNLATASARTTSRGAAWACGRAVELTTEWQDVPRGLRRQRPTTTTPAAVFSLGGSRLGRWSSPTWSLAPGGRRGLARTRRSKPPAVALFGRRARPRPGPPTACGSSPRRRRPTSTACGSSSRRTWAARPW